MHPVLIAHLATATVNTIRAGVALYGLRRRMSRTTKPDESVTYQSDEDSGAVLADLTGAFVGNEGRQSVSYRGFIFNPNTLKYDIRA